VGRDRYAEFVSLAAITATTLERIATEIRNLQRTEIGEVSEHFDERKQVGSSTMAHKRNPIVCENVCGLARVLRGFMLPAYDNMVLWHERDLTNSAAERFIVPHVAVLLDDIMVKMERVLRTLVVNEERMRENLMAHPEVTAEAVIMALVRKGVGRNVAHEMVRVASVGREGEEWVKSIMGSKVTEYLLEGELKKILNPLDYIGHAPEIARAVVRRVFQSREGERE
jgi:adenylosuccinate lyase